MLNLEHLFPMRNNIYLIPHWILSVLRRNGLNNIDVLNYSKLQRILSMNDLASIQVLQSFGEDLLGTRDVVSSSILYEWYSSADNALKESLRKEIEPLAADPILRDTVKERLGDDEARRQDQPVFEVLPLEDKALMVVLYPGIFTGMNYDRHFEIVQALLRQLYVYEQQPDVAGTPLFRRYLDLLSLRKP